MSDSTLTCERVDEQDLDTRYLAGKLSEADAEAFEEHYFSCDRCWHLVRTGNDVRAAMGDAGGAKDEAGSGTLEAARASRNDPPRAVRVSRFPRPALLAAAAAIVLATGLWMADRGGRAPTPAEFRGSADSLHLVVSTRDRMLVATWRGVAAANIYRARLVAGDGTLLVERETADTTVIVAADSVRSLAGRDVAYWEVQALSPAREVLARSAPRETRLPPRRP